MVHLKYMKITGAIMGVSLGLIGLSGCASSSQATSAATESPDWTNGYNNAASNWSQPGFRTLMQTLDSNNETKVSMCNYITQNTIPGFNPFNGFRNQTEHDFYNGCEAYFVGLNQGF